MTRICEKLAARGLRTSVGSYFQACGGVEKRQHARHIPLAKSMQVVRSLAVSRRCPTETRLRRVCNAAFFSVECQAEFPDFASGSFPFPSSEKVGCHGFQDDCDRACEHA